MNNKSQYDEAYRCHILTKNDKRCYAYYISTNPSFMSLLWGIFSYLTRPTKREDIPFAVIFLSPAFLVEKGNVIAQTSLNCSLQKFQSIESLIQFVHIQLSLKQINQSVCQTYEIETHFLYLHEFHPTIISELQIKM